MPSVLLVQDAGKKIGIDAVHHRSFMAIQLELFDGAAKGVQNPVADHL